MNRFTLAGAFSAAALLSAAAVTPALAQSSAQCRELGTDAERIACLEARIDALEEALSERDEGEGVGEAVTAAPTPAPVAEGSTFGSEQLDAPAVSAPAASASVVAEPAAREGRRWLRMPNIPFLGDDDEDEGAAAPTAVAAAPVPAQPPAVAPVAGPDAFGAEQIAARTETRAESRRGEDEEVLSAQIVDFQVLHRGRLVVALDNGQMWRQMDVDTRQIRLREGESYPVEIRRSGFGGYRMKVADNDRIMTVERLR